jgi:hypothetical protein
MRFTRSGIVPFSPQWHRAGVMRFYPQVQLRTAPACFDRCGAEQDVSAALQLCGSIKRGTPGKGPSFEPAGGNVKKTSVFILPGY